MDSEGNAKRRLHAMVEPAKPTPNHCLRRERERRAWSQQDLVDQVGTTPLNDSRWERGINSLSPLATLSSRLAKAMCC